MCLVRALEMVHHINGTVSLTALLDGIFSYVTLTTLYYFSCNSVLFSNYIGNSSGGGSGVHYQQMN